jgi:hypothetical protein
MVRSGPDVQDAGYQAGERHNHMNVIYFSRLGIECNLEYSYHWRST